jgi:hypothetical protein
VVGGCEVTAAQRQAFGSRYYRVEDPSWATAAEIASAKRVVKTSELKQDGDRATSDG